MRDDDKRLIGTAPDVYSNRVKFGLSTYDIVLQFGMHKPRSDEPQPIVNVYMSPGHAWVMAKLFERNMREYVEQVGPISIPGELLDELDLRQEYVHDMKGAT